eukprot:TRINITY_DN3911_c0_g2_i5.p2 TRINITY_DN3911_c0_g2~~TRINITY_DN3911_c0_g2_i5.p2  ORF type:complete len:244 (+),score=78.09 TRINITY_DN3911_c0_g2_i5:96-734(+)
MQSFKVVVVGDSGVGKTSLIRCFATGAEPGQHTATLGSELTEARVSLGCGRHVRLDVWDTAGQERYRAMCAQQYRSAQGCVLVFDLTCEQSFRSLDGWLAAFKDSVGDSPGWADVCFAVVGNKADLENHRTVTCVDGEAWAKRLQGEGAHCAYLETSVAEASGGVDGYVAKVFQDLAAAMVQVSERQVGVKSPETIVLADAAPGRQRKKGCC